jgi:hypothetical protein
MAVFTQAEKLVLEEVVRPGLLAPLSVPTVSPEKLIGVLAGAAPPQPPPPPPPPPKLTGANRSSVIILLSVNIFVFL